MSWSRCTLASGHQVYALGGATYVGGMCSSAAVGLSIAGVLVVGAGSGLVGCQTLAQAGGCWLWGRGLDPGAAECMAWRVSELVLPAPTPPPSGASRPERSEVCQDQRACGRTVSQNDFHQGLYTQGESQLPPFASWGLSVSRGLVFRLLSYYCLCPGMHSEMSHTTCKSKGSASYIPLALLKVSLAIL